MLILRGIAGTFGGRHYPRGALDEAAALEYARRLGFRGEVLDIAGSTSGDRPQVRMALERIRAGASIAALYGFSGGGYNLRLIWAALRPEERARIQIVVVIGAPKISKADFPGCPLIMRGDPPAGHMAGPRALLAELGPAPAPAPAAPTPPSLWSMIVALFTRKSPIK